MSTDRSNRILSLMAALRLATQSSGDSPDVQRAMALSEFEDYDEAVTEEWTDEDWAASDTATEEMIAEMEEVLRRLA